MSREDSAKRLVDAVREHQDLQRREREAWSAVMTARSAHIKDLEAEGMSTSRAVEIALETERQGRP